MAKKKESPKKGHDSKSNPESRKIREPIREKNRVKSNNSKSNAPLKKEKEPEKTKRAKHSSDSGKITQILKLVAIGLGIIFIIILLIFLLNQDSSKSNNNSVLENMSNNSKMDINNLKLISITNSNCEFCQEELVIQDMKILLNDSNLTIENIEIGSQKSNEFKELLLENDLNFDFAPIFILTKEIEMHQLFNEPQFQTLFISFDNYYVLNPQITQIKYTDETIELPSEVISIGNEQGVHVTYISDYFCGRCNIMEGKPQVVENAQLQGVIPQNYSAPIPQLLLSSLYANSSDLSFKFNFIPAPINENSTRAHKAVYCAYKQDSFVQMHATLINDDNLSLEYTLENYSQIAQNLGLDTQIFTNCYENEANTYINTTQEYLVDMGIATLPITIVGNYPSTEIMDSQTMALLLSSQLEANEN